MGVIGVTLKRRRMLASRSCTERMPAPHSPLPRIPMVSTVPTKYAMPCAGAGVKHLREGEKENERKQVVEEQHRAVAQGQPQVAPEQREVGSHSRRLFPVSSMKASSSDGRWMRMSTSSRPFSSSHFTISTTVRAGL